MHWIMDENASPGTKIVVKGYFWYNASYFEICIVEHNVSKLWHIWIHDKAKNNVWHGTWSHEITCKKCCLWAGQKLVGWLVS